MKILLNYFSLLAANAGMEYFLRVQSAQDTKRQLNQQRKETSKKSSKRKISTKQL